MNKLDQIPASKLSLKKGDGYSEDDDCPNRHCEGYIYKEDGCCTCHCGNPPCSYCESPKMYCSGCSWEPGMVIDH